MVKKSRKEAKKEQKTSIKGKIAHILFLIAVLFLFGSSIFTLIFREDISLALNSYYSVSLDEIALVTYSVIWFAIGVLTWITNYKIRKTNSRSQKWMLFAWSFITMVAGSLEAGFVMLVSSIVYLMDK